MRRKSQSQASRFSEFLQKIDGAAFQKAICENSIDPMVVGDKMERYNDPANWEAIEPTKKIAASKTYIG